MNIVEKINKKIDKYKENYSLNGEPPKKIQLGYIQYKELDEYLRKQINVYGNYELAKELVKNFTFDKKKIFLGIEILFINKENYIRCLPLRKRIKQYVPQNINKLIISVNGEEKITELKIDKNGRKYYYV